MTDWHFATAYEKIADVVGDQPALICNDVVRTWSEFDDRAARLASVLSSYGLGPDSKVGIYLHNCNEYLEAHHGILKMRGCPINVNYRYTEEELIYLLNNADVEGIVYLGSYAPRIDKVLKQLDRVRCLIQVDAGDGVELLDDALDYEEAIADESPQPRMLRPANDLYMLYTGGTTGLPKGVMYDVGVHCKNLANYSALLGIDPVETMEELPGRVAASRDAGLLPVSLVCCPLMHGTGIWVGSMISHLCGGAVITVDKLGLDADLLWSVAQKHRATTMTIVGDAFARPLLKALDEAEQRQAPYDISSVKTMLSSGVMWSQEVKQGLLKHNDMTLVDAMGSTEGGMGMSVTNRESSAATAKFQLGEAVKVFDEDDREVESGSGRIGMIATRSAMIGYYKDSEKSGKTIRKIGGERYVFPGDFAQVEADGSITLLGRGSMCINTAGEKVFPEEVEEVVKRHGGIVDCLVVGVPDERFGERVVAVASRSDGALAEQALVDFCRDHIAGYKLPRQVFFVDQVQRAPNGKADYKWAKQVALDQLAAG